MTNATMLESLLARDVLVLTNDGKILCATLEGFDHSCNVVLSDCHERIFDKIQGVQVIRHGLFVLRGDNLALIGELNGTKDDDLTSLTVPPLKPIVH